jgi:voltage-gated potassium channel
MVLEALRDKLHDIIFEADTPVGKAFDVALIASILISVAVVMLDSMASVRAEYGSVLVILEWVFTILFTIEYLLRLWIVRQTWRYAFSFFGIVDFLSIVPSYLSLLLPGSQYLLVIRLLRTIRIWRILKLAHFLVEFNLLVAALRASTRKIVVFLLAVICLVVVLGSLMYVIEPSESGFTSIPRSVYWAIVTLTTVGYGDISPQTGPGQFLASLAMILGYAIIAVPTGIVTVELASAQSAKPVDNRACLECGGEGHDRDAVFCKHCGNALTHHPET